MYQVDKIINAGNCELVIKWSDGRVQSVKAVDFQEECPCANCSSVGAQLTPEVKILSFSFKGRFGIQLEFSSGCQCGIYSFNQIRSWLKNL